MPSRSRLRAEIIASIDAAAEQSGFSLTSEQHAVLNRLLSLAEDLLAPGLRRRRPRSVYVWGPAGRGKSWLLDAFYNTLPTEQKRRVHFHGFFEELHRQLHEHQGAADAMAQAVAGLTDGARVLFFDEFHVHDSGDATLLTRLLRQLVTTDVVLLASSNYAPASLLPNPIWHHIFEPGIELILEHMDVVELTGATDHRASPATARGGFRNGAWITPATGVQWEEHGLRAPTSDEATVLSVRNRRFPVSAARAGELWISFEQACATPTSSIEFLDWAGRFDRWVLTDVPSFAQADPESQQRFINLIDILSDADLPLCITSDLSPGQFHHTAAQRPDAFRMLSRLQLLQTPTLRP